MTEQWKNDELFWNKVYEICILFLFSLETDNHKDANKIGNHGEAVEANSNIVKVDKVINKPENLSEYDYDLEFNFTFCIKKPGE